MRLTKIFACSMLVLAFLPLLEKGASAAWGPRFGVSDGPDQVIAGFHWHGGTIAPRLHIQPNAKIGIGSDRKVFAMAAPLHYRFPVRSRVTPFVGGGVAAGLVDHDFTDETNFEIALEAIGGLEWRLSSGSRFALELDLGFGDLYDLQLVAGWVLR